MKRTIFFIFLSLVIVVGAAGIAPRALAATGGDDPTTIIQLFQTVVTLQHQIIAIMQQRLSTVSSSNAIDVTGMQHYTNTDFGFSFWYPTGYEAPVSINPGLIGIGSHGNNYALIYLPRVFLNSTTGRAETLADIMKSYAAANYTRTTVIVGGISSFEVTGIQIGTLVFVPVSSNQILEMVGNSADPLFNHILSTFQISPSQMNGPAPKINLIFN